MSECVLASGARNRKGYVMKRCPIRKNNFGAHRLAWIERHGPIPEGMVVMHTCDNPPCVNIEHLRLGTTAENVADMMAKGRNSKGESRPLSVLSEMAVRVIRRLCANGVMAQSEIAATFGVCQPTVHKIHARKAWRHLL